MRALVATLNSLRDDFQHNLGLLDARDAELARYDAEMARLRASVTERDRRVAHLRLAAQVHRSPFQLGHTGLH